MIEVFACSGSNGVLQYLVSHDAANRLQALEGSRRDISMTPEEEQFQSMLRRLREGEPEAAREFHEQYGELLLRVIRRRLAKRFRRQFDSDDFQQDVYASFFREMPPPEAIASSRDFFNYLTTMARRKILDALRKRMSPKRAPAEQERSLDGSARIEGLKQIGPEPTGSQVIMAEEKVHELTRGKPAKYREIVAMATLGFTHIEIAERLQLHVKVVHRVLTGLQAKVAT